MSMHLEGPWLSTTGKKKSKRKFASAEQARKSRENRESWEEMLKRHGIEQEQRKQKRAMSSGVYKGLEPYRRENEDIKSLPFTGGVCAKPEPKVYTGDKVLGIATLHKSNAVPVFSSEEAVDISKMRR